MYGSSVSEEASDCCSMLTMTEPSLMQGNLSALNSGITPLVLLWMANGGGVSGTSSYPEDCGEASTLLTDCSNESLVETQRSTAVMVLYYCTVLLMVGGVE